MTARLITAIRIEQLFGLYTYEIPETGELSNAAILYGDNGVGKSTILRLVFHLLSAANNRGHRTALYEATFKRLEVTLASGVKLTAHFVEEKTKILIFEVWKNEKKLAVWDYRPRSSGFVDSESLYIEFTEGGRRIVKSGVHSKKASLENTPRGEHAFLAALEQYVPTLFILNADRRLDSDAVADPSDEVELRRVMQFGEPKRINELVVRSREIALSQALAAAAKWISRKAVIGANKGAMNVHYVYEDVLSRISASRNEVAITASIVSELQKQLIYIDNKSAEHARYELATHLPTNDFRRALSGGGVKKRELAAELLKPYIKSVESRLEAVEPIYQLIDRFVAIVNRFLNDKIVIFKLSQGFSIQNKLGTPLSAAQLSSGEQQLLLLFCYVLTARDTPSVFMIDEPEISLNIKWQRQLVQSLLDITSEADIQFIFASHSMELLAQHRNRVVKLVS